MKFAFEVRSSQFFVIKIFSALAFGCLVAFFFKLAVFNTFFEEKQFSDYGPTLFSGGDPLLLLYQYIVLVVASTFMGWFLVSKDIKIWPIQSFFNKENYVKSIILIFGAFSFALLPLFSALEISGNINFIGAEIIFSGIAVIFLQDRAFSSFSLFKSLEYLLKKIFLFLFISLVLFHLPKISVLDLMSKEAGLLYEIRSYFFLFVAALCALSFFLTRDESKSNTFYLALLLCGIYIASIRESWVYWGLDAFHEGENFLSPILLLASNKIFLQDFYPIHGLGRNIWHGYFAAKFSSDNLYFFRLIQALTYPVVHSLAAAFLYKYSKSFFVPVTFFVLTYLTGFLEERDLPPLFFVLFLLLPLANNQIKEFSFSQCSVGFVLFLISIYSFEFFIFVPVAMAASLFFYLYQFVVVKNKIVPWVHISYFGSFMVFFLWLGDRTVLWFKVIISALSKSPNLLERSFSVPSTLSLEYVLIAVFFLVFMFFHISSVVFFLKKATKSLTLCQLVTALFSMISLMFFVRAFNRSDAGHVLYAFGASIPIMIGLLIYYKFLSVRVFMMVGGGLLCALLFELHQKDRLFFEVLSERARYDQRVSETEVRKMTNVGNITVPENVINDSHITNDELLGLQTLVDKGYTLFDLTNQPVLIYGVVGSPIVTRDIHSLFYSGYKEQNTIIEELKESEKTLIIWSSGHWSETLDHTYVETRLPLVSEFILNRTNYLYEIGRFQVLSEEKISGFNHSLNNASSNLIRQQYEYGFSPSRVNFYPEERATLDFNSKSNSLELSGVKPDAIKLKTLSTHEDEAVVLMKSENQSIASIKFKVKAGENELFFRLSSLPVYVFNNITSIELEYNQEKTNLLAFEASSKNSAL